MALRNCQNEWKCQYLCLVFWILRFDVGLLVERRRTKDFDRDARQQPRRRQPAAVAHVDRFRLFSHPRQILDRCLVRELPVSNEFDLLANGQAEMSRFARADFSGTLHPGKRRRERGVSCGGRVMSVPVDRRVGLLRPGLNHEAGFQTRDDVAGVRTLAPLTPLTLCCGRKPVDVIRMPVSGDEHVQLVPDNAGDVLGDGQQRVLARVGRLLRGPEVDQHVAVGRRARIVEREQETVSESHSVGSNGQTSRLRYHRSVSRVTGRSSGSMPFRCSAAKPRSRGVAS